MVKSEWQKAEEYLRNLVKEKLKWPGGYQRGDEPEFFFVASDAKDIRYMLRNLEAAEKHCCYVKPNSSIADTLTNRFVKEKRTVDARYLEMISNAQWYKSLTHHKYRFDANFSGEGLDLLF